MIPKFTKAILENKDIIINGTGTQSRDFTYIDNVVDANLKACVAPESANGRIFNVACGKNTSVNDIYKILSDILKKDTNVKYGEERKGDIKNSLADIEETYNVLKYKPIYNVREGLEKTVKWYVENLKIER